VGIALAAHAVVVYGWKVFATWEKWTEVGFMSDDHHVVDCKRMTSRCGKYNQTHSSSADLLCNLLVSHNQQRHVMPIEKNSIKLAWRNQPGSLDSLETGMRVHGEQNWPTSRGPHISIPSRNGSEAYLEILSFVATWSNNIEKKSARSKSRRALSTQFFLVGSHYRLRTSVQTNHAILFHRHLHVSRESGKKIWLLWC